MCTPDQLIIRRLHAPVQLCQFARLGVTSSKIQKLGGSHVKKSVPLWHVLFVPLITGYPTGFCPRMVVIGPQSLSRIRPLVDLQH